MKVKKFASLLCAVSMLLTSAITASAAEPLSEYAGETISVQVVRATETGSVSQVIQAAIPEGATKAEEDAIVYAAALGQDMIAPLSSGYAPHVIGTKRNFTIHPTPLLIGSTNWMPTGSNGYDEVIIDITFSPYVGGDHKVLFRVQDVHTPDNSVEVPTEAAANVNRVITIGTMSLVTDPSKGIKVYARTEEGNSVQVSTCTISVVASAK